MSVVVIEPEVKVKLHTVPVTLAEANEFVKLFHRHHGPTVSHKWSIGIADESGTLRGVAICGRPVARGLDDGTVLEVNRLATDGCPNACSALYAACRRVAKTMGYTKVITYILESEPGTSLKAAGWVQVAVVKGRSWDTPSRRREDDHPTVNKTRWEAN